MRNEKKVLFLSLFLFSLLSPAFLQEAYLTGEEFQTLLNIIRQSKACFGTADGAHSGIESGITGARGGIERSLDRTGIIGSGLEGIGRLAVENTELLGEAERILLGAGERERGTETE
jgi:hypothetical protein